MKNKYPYTVYWPLKGDTPVEMERRKWLYALEDVQDDEAWCYVDGTGQTVGFKDELDATAFKLMIADGDSEHGS